MCQDFVYAAKAQTGWAGDILGLISIDVSKKNTTIAYRNLFLRTGLVDTLPSEASPFDRDLALCADGIVLKWEWDYYLSMFGHMDDKEEAITLLLRKLEQSVSSILDDRRKKTLIEARETGFEERLYDTITSFLATIETDSEITYSDRMPTEHQFAVKTQSILRRLLAPWAHIDIHLGLHGRLVVQLRHFESRQLFRPCLKQTETFTNKINVLVWQRWEMLCLMFRRLEMVHASILGDDATTEEYAEFASCFRKYLESGGDEATLPIINSGTNIERIQTPAAFRKQHMSTLPHSSKWESEKAYLAKRARQRQSDNPEAMKARFQIKKYFLARTNSADRDVQQVPRFWQLIEENATTPAPRATRPRPRSSIPSDNARRTNTTTITTPAPPALNATFPTGLTFPLPSPVALLSRPHSSPSAPAALPSIPPQRGRPSTRIPPYDDDVPAPLTPPKVLVAPRSASAHPGQAAWILGERGKWDMGTGMVMMTVIVTIMVMECSRRGGSRNLLLLLEDVYGGL